MKPQGTTKQTTITIRKCPLCGKSHPYDAVVTTSNMQFVRMPPPKEFTRLFTCPVKNETFQATITLAATTTDVEISGSGK
jgi:hypothetical protein